MFPVNNSAIQLKDKVILNKSCFYCDCDAEKSKLLTLVFTVAEKMYGNYRRPWAEIPWRE